MNISLDRVPFETRNQVMRQWALSTSILTTLFDNKHGLMLSSHLNAHLGATLLTWRLQRRGSHLKRLIIESN